MAFESKKEKKFFGLEFLKEICKIKIEKESITLELLLHLRVKMVFVQHK